MRPSGLGTLTDDEEVTIPSLDRNREILDFPDYDIRDEQTLSNTQREDWLLRKEPVYGARPRQTGREDLPVMDNRPETGSDSSVVTRTAGFDGRGGDHTAEGGGGVVRPLSLRVHCVGYEQYLIRFLMILRRTSYGMAA